MNIRKSYLYLAWKYNMIVDLNQMNLAGTEVTECDDNTFDGATIATLPIYNARKGMIKPVGYKGSSVWRARSKATPRGDTRAAAVMCDVAWHDVGIPVVVWVRRGRTWCIWCAGIGAERRQMGVRRIPLRLPRAAPVPLCPGSSSISPCVSPPVPFPPQSLGELRTELRFYGYAIRPRRSRRAPSILPLAPLSNTV